MSHSIKTALLTGGNGNLGKLVAARLLERGVRVIKFDIPGTEPDTTEPGETIVIGDMRDLDQLQSLITEYKPDTVYHLASLLSGSSEANHVAAWEINATGSFNLLRFAVEAGVERFFFAGTTASYGGKLDDPLPDSCEQWPENIYGATKVAVERLGVFYKHKNNLDFRVLRFPLVLSPYAPPTAVTAFPSHAFRAAMNNEPFVFPVGAESGMSTLFLTDVISSIIDYTHAPREKLTRHAYNLHAYHLTTQMVIDDIVRRYPNFQYSFSVDPVVESLLNNWPNVIDDSSARTDWAWLPEFDFAKSTDEMIAIINAEKAT